MNLDKHVSSEDFVVVEQFSSFFFFSQNEPLHLSKFLSFTQDQGCRVKGKMGHLHKQNEDRQIHHEGT